MYADDGRSRVFNAVEALAASAEPIHRRLQTAGVTLLPLQAQDFANPRDGELLEEILRALTGVADPTGEHGDIAFTTFSMSDEEAARVAALIVELLRRLT